MRTSKWVHLPQTWCENKKCLKPPPSIYTWNLFVLYFGASTLQNKPLSNQNSGHLGSRHIPRSPKITGNWDTSWDETTPQSNPAPLFFSNKWQVSTWMSRWKLGSMVRINGLYPKWGILGV